jgi:hypothetical protein
MNPDQDDHGHPQIGRRVGVAFVFPVREQRLPASEDNDPSPMMTTSSKAKNTFNPTAEDGPERPKARNSSIKIIRRWRNRWLLREVER